VLSTPGVLNFVPRPIATNLSLGGIPNTVTSTDVPFSLTVTSASNGVLTYSSSVPGVATINSSGLVTPVSAGTTTITVNQAASADGVYVAATASIELVVSAPAAPTQRGFSVLTDNSDFASLDFDSDMTTLFENEDDVVLPITMPNSNFTFNSAAYATLYLSSNAWLSFGTNVSEYMSGNNNQQPINTFRFFGLDHESSGYYKFISNNTRLLIKLTGYIYGSTTKTFTIKLIIEQSGEIRTNYTLSSTFTSNKIIIGFVGANSSITSDDIFLTLSDSTFNGSTALDLYSLLNGKTILYIHPKFQAFGTFTLPPDIQVYRNQTITRVLTPPTSNSSGAFTFTSSNTAVATISISGGVYSINVVGGGTTTITATQAASGDYASSSVSASLTVTLLYPTFGLFTLPSDELVYQNQTITRVLTPPTSTSSGAFTFTSSNTAVATISISSGVSSINVVGGGTTIIGVVQAASGDYASSSIAVLLNTVTGTSFSTEGVLWNQKGDDIDGEAAYDNSGYSVNLSADGNIVAIGAYGNDGNGTSSGHTRVFIRDSNKTTAVTDQASSNFGPVGWTRLGGDIVGEAANDNSGYSVNLSADGNIVAIGAYGNRAYAGHTRVFIRDSNKTTAVTDQASSNFGPIGWTRLGGDIVGEAAYDNSGVSVSLSSDGNIVAIGAYGNRAYAGHTRVFIRDSNKTTAVTDQASSNFGPVGWTRLGGDIVGEAAYDYSGRSVSLSSDGTIVAIGAYGNRANGTNSGHTRVFKLQ
jgi:hypothetical protein